MMVGGRRKAVKKLSDKEFRALLDWWMVSDPWPIKADQATTVDELLSKEARARGFHSSVQAYHDFSVE